MHHGLALAPVLVRESVPGLALALALSLEIRFSVSSHRSRQHTEPHSHTPSVTAFEGQLIAQEVGGMETHTRPRVLCR